MSSLEIIPLETKHTEDIIQIISAAFNDYPLMNFFFDSSDRRSLEAVGRYICDLATIDDSLLLGALVRDELQGIIFVTPPNANKNRDENAISALEARLARSLQDEALERMDIYGKLKNANKPQQPHFYINMLGVDPRCQRMGIGSQLLKHIHTLSDNHAKSCGVALDTQTKTNVAYYQSLGYRVSSRENLDRLENWFMFREKA